MSYTHSISISGNFRDELTTEWAGSGKCDPETGEIECSANLDGDAYDQISDQLSDGDTDGQVSVPGDRGYDVTYHWSIEQTHCRCNCGALTGERCNWFGPLDETVIVEYMPEHLRASHTAAGNSGVYPHNGAQRIRVEASCADSITHIWRDGEQTNELDPWVQEV